MQRINIDSTMINTIGYDAEKRRLEIDFFAGGVYCYQDVSQAVYDALMAADPIGDYIRDQLDPNHTSVQGQCPD